MIRSIYRLNHLFSNIKYTKSHEWIQYFPDQKKARIGITNHAQQQLGEIIHVEMPSVDKCFEANDSALVIQSVKIAADVYAPFTGKILTVNGDVAKEPTLINQAADKSWLFQISADHQPTNVLSEEQYKKFLEE